MPQISDPISRHLRLRLLVWLFVIPAPPLLLTVWFAQQGYSRLEEERREEVQTLALHTIDTLDRVFFERYGDAQIFSQLPVVRGMETDRITAVAKAVVTTYAPYYALIVVADRDGLIRAVNPVDGNDRPIASQTLIGQSVRGEPWFEEALTGRTVLVQDFHDDPQARRVFGENSPKMMLFSTRIMGSAAKGQEGQVVGVWSARIPEPAILQMLKSSGTSIQERDNLRITVFTKEGHEIGASSRGQDQVVMKHLGKGDVELVSVKPLASAASTGFGAYPGVGWTVRVYPPIEGMPARTPFSLPMAAGIIASIIAGMAFIWWLTNRHILRPLEALAQAAEALTRGEAAVIPQEPGRHDAIGVLQTGVADMVATLRTHAAALKHRTDALQVLIEEIREMTATQMDTWRFLHHLTEAACRLTGARYGALGVFDKDGKKLEHFITYGIDEATRSAIGDLPAGRGLLGMLVQGKDPLRFKDLSQHPAAAGFPPHHPPMRSFLGMSIWSNDRLFGRLYLTERQGADEFTELDEHIIAALAAQAGVIIENARLLQEMRWSEEALRTSNQELENFVYAISHDLQTPLRAIHGFADLLAKRVQSRLEGKDLHFLERIQSGTQRMSVLINDLLEYSRIERVTHPFEEVPMAEVLAKALEDMEDLISRNRAAIQCEGPLPAVWADRIRMAQVWTNLLSNAIKYAQPGVPPRIAIRCTEDDKAFTFHVQDNGIGIAPEFHARIFGLFQRLHTQEAYAGTGIGLALVKRIVEFHKGRVWVESAEGQGSTFFFTIPKKIEAQDNPTATHERNAQ